ncbi:MULTISPECIES: YaaR family protein [Oceanobacillus]|uniref:DUF327 family protein n=1 Tax=Oceanobacillus kimchii TaxID=746691 RepID=A0ABQ5TE43_9BACI|nr:MULTISPECIES: YaaR family protein [Oceanobacillus]MBT2599861.1 YaaR family protein [Oceanobacillus sp. ISL-74]MBT2652689.1 YaaR family protein [Oceanobacillus sp. ISL-73]MCT1577232.1 YaaR family protein [Oceanobacillus kimchii]MCT2135302.1 YaaR family protein [Oceanobacillus kimchii]OEH56567.1 hypothetical protein AQ616_03350 [Oceanobacillus sp. E9]
MKITNEMQTKTEPKFHRSSKVEDPSFQRMVQSQTKHLNQQEFHQLVQQLSKQGSKLAQYRSFRELVKFKRMVKSFLDKAVAQGYKLEKSHSFGLQGSRHLSIVKEVDEKLIQLAEDIMDEEKKTVDILGLIGEIKGLLINIYT